MVARELPYTDQAKDNPYPRTYPLFNQLKQFVGELDAANPNAAGPGRGVSGLMPNPAPPGNAVTIGHELAFRVDDLDSRALDFIQASGARKHKVSITGVYNFTDGRLRGWSIGGGALPERDARRLPAAILRQRYTALR